MNADIPHVLAHRGSVSRGWAPADVSHSLKEAIGDLRASAWTKIRRRFREAHTETWWAAELTFLCYGPHRTLRHRRDDRPQVAARALDVVPDDSLPQADAPPAEIVRLYGLRIWVEEGYKRVKGDQGWVDFQLRRDRAIRRHWALVCCACSFCWWHESHGASVRHAPNEMPEQSHRPMRQRYGGKTSPHAVAALRLPSWPVALRHVARVARPVRVARTLLPWTTMPLPPEFAALLAAVTAGHGLSLYLPN